MGHLNAGLRALDDVTHVLYPTEAPAAAVAFGPYSLEVARDAPVAGERLPVVAISHGTSSSPWTLRGLALHLAHGGFAVVMVEHVGNSRRDNSLADTPAILELRPRQLRAALDRAASAMGEHLAPDRVAVIGHSIGGYTALAAAGGRPISLPDENADGVAHPVAVEPDSRVHAVVLLAPALPWFMAPGALDAVRVRLLVRTGEHDALTPPAFVERILAGRPVDYAVVPGAGHFSFQSPFPPSMTSPTFPPSQDPPGFDRAAYQPRLHEEVRGFLAH